MLCRIILAHFGSEIRVTIRVYQIFKGPQGWMFRIRSNLRSFRNQPVASNKRHTLPLRTSGFQIFFAKRFHFGDIHSAANIFICCIQFFDISLHDGIIHRGKHFESIARLQ